MTGGKGKGMRWLGREKRIKTKQKERGTEKRKEIIKKKKKGRKEEKKNGKGDKREDERRALKGKYEMLFPYLI